MLKNLLKLRLRILLHSLSAGKKNDRKKRQNKSKKALLILVGFCVLVCFASFYALLQRFFELLSVAASALDMQWLFFALASSIAVLLSVFGSVFSTQSQLFDAKDNELLLSMPIKPRDILLSRLLVVYLLNFLFSALVLIPCGVAALLAFETTALGIVVFALNVLLLPLFSTALCCLLGWLLSLLTARMNNKAIMTTLMTIGFLVIYYVFYFRFINVISNEDGVGVLALQALLKSIEMVFSRFMPPCYWFGKLFAEGNAVCGLGVLAISVLPFILAVYLLSRSFMSIAMGKSGAKKRSYTAKEMKAGSLRGALVRKELKHFSSSAAYMTNCGISVLLLLSVGVILLIKQDVIPVIQGFLQQFGLAEEVVYLLLVFMLCFAGFCNTMTAPSVSLEGKSRWIVQTIPTDMRNVLLAKVDMQLILTVPVLLFVSIVAAASFELSGGWLAMVLLVPQACNALNALAGVWLNVLMPKYEWTSENVPVKQGAPVAGVMFGTMFYCGAPAVLYLWLLKDVLTPLSMLGIFGLVTVCLCAVLWRWIYKKGGKRFLEAG